MADTLDTPDTPDTIRSEEGQQIQRKNNSSRMTQFGPSDILCGRSKLARNHCGNRDFRQAVGLHLQQYLDAPTKTKKSFVVENIFDVIKEKRGKFWKLDEKANGGDSEWVELDVQQARDKIAHVFRDMVSALRRKRGRRSDSRSDTSSEGGDQSIASSSTSKTRAKSPDVPKMNKNKTGQPSTVTQDGLSAVSPVMPSTLDKFAFNAKYIRRRVGTHHISNAIPRREAHLEKHFIRSRFTNPEHASALHGGCVMRPNVSEFFPASGRGEAISLPPIYRGLVVGPTYIDPHLGGVWKVYDLRSTHVTFTPA